LLNVKVVFGIALLLFFIFVGCFPKLFTHFSPYYHDEIHVPSLDTPAFPPSKLHPFGTDNSGRDTLSRIVYGTLPTLRDASILVFVTVLLSFFISTVTTLYKPRFIRFVLDTLGNAFVVVPPIVVAVLVLEIPQVLLSPKGPYWYYGVIMAIEVARFVKIMEGDMRIVYNKPFIEGAVIAGSSSFGIFRRHMLRWLLPYIMEYIPSEYARILTIVGELGYFGLYNNIQVAHAEGGPLIQTNELNWAATLAEGSHAWFSTPTIVFFTTLAFCVLIFAFRLLAAGIAQATEIERPQYWAWKEKPLRKQKRRLHTGFRHSTSSSSVT
jgi:ABC-type dipeptide/oligopeptide/nickel transport system permease subunit